MSEKKKEEEKPCFEIDENGKLKLLTIPPPSTGNSEVKSSSKKRWNKVPIERLNLNTESSSNDPSKSSSKKPWKAIPIRRLDPEELTTDADSAKHVAKKSRMAEKNVRKELFKSIPKSEGTNLRRSSIASKIRTSSGRQSFLRKQASNKKAVFNSSLINVEEAEEQILNRRSLRNRGYEFKSPSVPSINFVQKNQEVFSKSIKSSPKNKTPVNSNRLKPPVEQTPQTLEFESFEKYYANNSSPLSSVCNLFAQTNIASTKKSPRNELNKNNSTINDLKGIVQKMQNDFILFHKQYSDDMRKCVAILNNLESNNTENRKSTRFASRINDKENKSKTHIISPAITTKTDLRKSTLKKNFTNKNNQGPLTAIQMNQMQSDVVLTTPKQVKSRLNSPTVARSLTKRIKSLEDQLLQDTPAHK